MHFNSYLSILCHSLPLSISTRQLTTHNSQLPPILQSQSNSHLLFCLCFLLLLDQHTLQSLPFLTFLFDFSLSPPIFSRNKSTLPNSAAYLTPQEPNEQESFAHFFESWMDEQTMLLQELRHSVSNSKPTSEEEESVLVPLIKRVMDHYNEYYKAKLKGGESEILSMLSPSWTSSLEDSFYWIGGWRPTTALQLLYSKSSSQFAARLEDIILEGVDTGDLGDLSPDQHRRIEELELKTIKQERKVTAKMAKHQETVATTEMVELSQIPSDMENEDQVNSAVTEKEEGLKKILEKADRLRWKTLKAVIRILEPCEAVHFLIGAAQLHLKVREWGHKIDDENHTSKVTHHENASGSGTHPDDHRS